MSPDRGPKTPETEFPKSLRPMKPIEVARPPINIGEWTAERKLDGIRAITLISPHTGIIITSSTGRDITRNFMGLHGGLQELATQHTAVLDGEIISGEGRNASDRNKAIGQAHPNTRSKNEEDFSYVIFDVPFLDGNLTGVEFEERRQKLEELINPQLVRRHKGRIKLSKTYSPERMRRLVRETGKGGFEGIVLKKLSSTYQPGVESWDWRKIKF